MVLHVAGPAPSAKRQHRAPLYMGADVQQAPSGLWVEPAVGSGGAADAGCDSGTWACRGRCANLRHCSAGQGDSVCGRI